ncbi:hypothetical protein K8I61_10530 [bacterium]|nr:hypothetical protein [bacterium]
MHGAYASNFHSAGIIAQLALVFGAAAALRARAVRRIRAFAFVALASALVASVGVMSDIGRADARRRGSAAIVQMRETLAAVPPALFESTQPGDTAYADIRARLARETGDARLLPAKDPWFARYRLDRDGDAWRLRSSGPDRRWDTPDDLAVGVRSESGGVAISGSLSPS